MTDTTTPATTTAPPAPAAGGLARLILNSAPWISQSIYVAAKLGVADVLADGPMSADELAARVGANPDALYRFCRALAALGVLEETGDRGFGLTEAGRELRDDAPGGLRYFAIVNGEESFRAWGHVMHSVTTGESAFRHLYGMSHFEYLASHPEASAAFNRMGGRGTAPKILDTVDFSADTLVVDVGGGVGTAIATVLARHPALQGVLLDLPSGVDGAAEYLSSQGVADRCRIVAGSFFDGVPAGGTSYLLSRVVHDWDDEDALRLLRQVRAAISPTGRLLVLDSVIPDGVGFHPGKFSDLQMLVVLGGRERTVAELYQLLDRAGFTVTDVRLPGPGAANPRAEALVQAKPR